MKIRNGFVSNSSSTSFCIFGAAFEPEEIKKIFNVEDPYDAEEKLKGSGLEFEAGQEGYTYYIGRSWKNIKDDETGKQFKESIQKAIMEAIGKEAAVECHTYEEAWYNG